MLRSDVGAADGIFHCLWVDSSTSYSQGFPAIATVEAKNKLPARQRGW